MPTYATRNMRTKHKNSPVSGSHLQQPCVLPASLRETEPSVATICTNSM